ncbi:MAG: patatin-like phospholipase family protein, partial [bacterium]
AIKISANLRLSVSYKSMPHHNPNKNKIGLVLSGGIFRSAFQVGVLEALQERNFRPQVIVGVSSGAWNGACLAAGQIRLMRHFWLQVGEIPKVSLRNFFFNRTLFNLRYIVHRVPKRQLHFERIANSDIEFHVGVTRLRNFQSHYFCNHKTVHDFFPILMASNWLPLLYSWPVQIGGCYYIDGGFVDNVPYEVAFEAGCSHVYIVLSNHEGKIFKKWGDKKMHRIPTHYRSRTTIIASTQPLHPFCAKKHQVEEAMEEGYYVGQKILL